MEKNDLLISQGNRPWWQIILAALFFTGMFVFLYYFLTTFNIYNPLKKVKGSLHFLQLAIFLFAGGVSFSIVKDYHFNFKEHTYKILYCVGPVKIGRWKQFENLGYISVFKNSKNFFEINLWYNKNRHFNISTYTKVDLALLAGEELALKLKIDLLDATDPYHSKWVDNLNQ